MAILLDVRMHNLEERADKAKTMVLLIADLLNKYLSSTCEYIGVRREKMSNNVSSIWYLE